jgi:hypothetical protein
LNRPLDTRALRLEVLDLELSLSKRKFEHRELSASLHDSSQP